MATIKIQSSYNPGTIRISSGGYTPMTPTTTSIQGSKVNPQKTAPSTVLQKPATTKTYQNTVKTSAYQKAVAANNAEAARRFALEQQRLEAARQAEKKRLADAKKAEIAGYKGSWAGKLADKASFGDLRRQRSSREAAAKFYKDNEYKWGGNIRARQQEYERRGAALKNWVMQSGSEAEWNKRLREANAWLDKEYKAINKEIADYTVTQQELATYSQKALTGAVPATFNFAKAFTGNLFSKSWNALTWTASQPSRVVNTTKNFVNPNNLRMYDNGSEKQGGITGKGSNPIAVSIDQLKKAYNASANQRIVGFSKADEAQRLAGWKKTVIVNGKPQTLTKTPSGVDKFRVKYGDDAVNLMLDPLMWLGGTGAAGKIKGGAELTRQKLYELAGKSKPLRNWIVGQAVKRETNPASFSKWLNKPQATRAGDFFRDNKKIIDARTRVADRMKAISGAWAERKAATFADTKFADDLSKLTDQEAELLQRFMNYTTYGSEKSGFARKAGFSWDSVDLPRGFGGAQRRKIEDLARSLKNYTDQLHGKDIEFTKWKADKVRYASPRGGKAADRMMRDVYEAYRKSYIPYYAKGGGKGQAADMTAWFMKQQKRIKLQTRAQLQRSFAQRGYATMRNTSPEGQQLKNLDRLGKEFEDLGKTLDVRAQSYKPNKWTKTNDWLNTHRKWSPASVWRKAVLKYNPAWYVNNTLWNVPASISAGGWGAVPETLRLMRKANYAKSLKRVPEGVASNIDKEIGKAGLASRIENTSRMAAFNALKKKGVSDSDALKRTNKWLFDYTTKNWERPIKSVLPFWQWQKNLLKLSATMPFHSPKSAKVYTEAYKQFYQRPYDALPDQTQTYTDPETGLPVTYNPKEFYKGKAKIGNNFYGLPFFAVNPETMLQFGLNPYMATAMDLTSSTNQFGSPNTNRKAWTVLAERFPQLNLARAFANRDNKDENRWFAESGSSKWSQGYDKSKPNYVESLDNQKKFGKQLKSFFGIPRSVPYNEKEYNRKFALTKFNNDFFATDWEKRLADLQSQAGDTQFGFDDPNSPYNVVKREQEAMAKKYGFDLQKDIYDNYWSKYDTAVTRNTKQLKRSAYNFNSDFWRTYTSLPVGSKTQASVRRPWLIGKYDEWKRNNTFLENPYYNIPEFNVYDSSGKKTGAKEAKNPFSLKAQQSQSEARIAAGKAKYQKYLDYQKAKKSGDWSAFERKYGKKSFSSGSKSSKYTYNGKYFKSQESMDRYKAGEKKYAIGQLWREYYTIRTMSGRKAFLEAHPEMQANTATPTTPEEWQAMYARIRETRKAKTAKLAGFAETQAAMKKQIERNLPNNWGRSRRLRYKY